MTHIPLPAAEHRTADDVYAVVRTPRLTCRWCTEPTSGAVACRHCTHHHDIPGVADLVVPLTYAIAGTESAKMLRDYKNHSSRDRRIECTAALTVRLRRALSAHGRCLEAAAGRPVDVATIIPSLTLRPGTHPLGAVLRDSGTAMHDVLTAASSATCHRTVRRDKFVVLDPRVIAGQHVLIVDDIWTTGSTAQSAALALRGAGAATVSVLVLGRWLNPHYPPTRKFLDRHLARHLADHPCPVTGMPCAGADRRSGRAGLHQGIDQHW